MRNFKKRAFASVTLLIFLTLSLFLYPLEAGECKDALVRCMVTALIIGVTNVYGGIIWGAFCAVGYAWCLEFMQ